MPRLAFELSRFPDAVALSSVRTDGFLVAMLMDTQLRADIWLFEAAIGDPRVRAFDGAGDQRVGL